MSGRRARPLTLRSLALRLGLSTTTVWNALNQPSQVSAAVRDYVVAGAAALGYRGPHQVARALRGGSGRQVGVVLGADNSAALADPAAAQFVQSLSAAAQFSGVELVLAAGPVPGLAGVIGYRISAGDTRFARCDARLVLVNSPELAVDAHARVAVDERFAGSLAGRQLLRLGHRRVGVIARRDDQRRLAGLRTGLGSVVVELVLARDEFNAAQAAAALVRRRPDLTAIACSCDALALGVIRAVGSAVSVIGIDDIAVASLINLATVHQPIDELAQVAWGALQHPESAPAPRLLPVHLVERGSLAGVGRRLSKPRSCSPLSRRVGSTGFNLADAGN